MLRPWRLTLQAEAALSEIAIWTFDVFGDRQAAAYERDLIDRCCEIAAGECATQSCRALLAPDLPEDLRFVRAGQHFIIFIEDATQVIIVDVLHSRSNLPARLAALSGPEVGRGD